MISVAFHAVVYDPLYNGLVFFVGATPTHDVGLAVIALTIAVRIILSPLSRRAVDAQLRMKQIAPEVEALKEKHKDNREEQARAIFALYRERKVSPFAGILIMFLQLPVLFALYWVFVFGGLPDIDPTLLYSFVGIPPAVNMEFFGFLDMAGHSVVLGLLAAASQFVYTRLTMGPRQKKAAKEKVSFMDDFSRSLDLQARYVFPAAFVFLSFIIPNAAMLYIVTGNIFMIGQEFLAGRRF